MPDTITETTIKYSRFTPNLKDTAIKAPVNPPRPIIWALIFHLNERRKRITTVIVAARMNFEIVGGAPSLTNK